MKYNTSDTIVALATPMGAGALAVVRLSGAQALSITNQCVHKPIPAEPRRVHFRHFLNANQELLDQVVVTFFQAPASYTGEDVVEISAHNNPLIVKGIIEETLRHGARVAEPGEFTYRAFLNGKMDLTQAEAVAEVIAARTRQSLTHSLRHLTGVLRDRILAIKQDVVNYLSLLEINLDFSDEEIEALPREELARRLDTTIERLRQLMHTYSYGKLLEEGIRILFMGRPNVGKSSLLNRLVGEERAIVSDIPGTTRDYIEAQAQLDGLLIRAVDTAGVRQTPDAIEALGIERTLRQAEQADVVAAVFEAPAPPQDDDQVLKSRLLTWQAEQRHAVVLLNKVDRGEHGAWATFLKDLSYPVVRISAKTGKGMDAFREALLRVFEQERALEHEDVVVTSERHRDALQRALEALEGAREGIAAGISDEFLAADIRSALSALGEIVGETTPQDLLNHIFSNFCIGK